MVLHMYHVPLDLHQFFQVDYLPQFTHPYLVSLFPISFPSNANYIHIPGQVLETSLQSPFSSLIPESPMTFSYPKYEYSPLHNPMSFINMFNRCQPSVLIDPQVQNIYPYSYGFAYVIPSYQLLFPDHYMRFHPSHG